MLTTTSVSQSTFVPLAISVPSIVFTLILPHVGLLLVIVIVGKSNVLQ